MSVGFAPLSANLRRINHLLWCVHHGRNKWSLPWASHARPNFTLASRKSLIFLQTINQIGTLQAVQILLSMLKTNHLVI